MIDATEGEDEEEGKLSDEEIVANSLTFLLAGFETTAITLSFASYLLALHPEIQEKLQTEIDEYFESKPVSQSLMHTTLTWLQANSVSIGDLFSGWVSSFLIHF